MHGSGMIYLVITPLALGIGLYLVPLQVGAPAVAAPRVTMLGYWLYLFGALAVLSGFLTTNGAAKEGWTAYTPLSSARFAPDVGTDLWILGNFLASLGMILLAGAVLWTVLLKRAPGMTMLRIPVFSWSIVATNLMVLAAFPSLLIALGLLALGRMDADLFASNIWNIGYQHLFWFYGHPVVYVMFFPFVGAVAEVLSTFTGRRFFGYRATVLSLLAFAALSMSVWGHHMFTTGQASNDYYSLTSIMLLVPAGIEYFSMLATVIGARIRFTVPMLFALAFIPQFLVGGLTGIMVATPALDYQMQDSYFVVAHFHHTLMAGSVFGFFAGFYFWFPNATGDLAGQPARPGALLAAGGRHEPDLPADVLAGAGRPAAPGRDLPARRRFRRPQPPGHDRVVAARSGHGGVRGQHRRVRAAPEVPPVDGQPVAGAHAGVGDELSPAAAQLRRRAPDPAGPRPRPAAGPARGTPVRPAVVVAGWAALNAALTLLLLFFGENPLFVGMYAGTVLITLAVAAVVYLAVRAPGERLWLATGSGSTVYVALAALLAGFSLMSTPVVRLPRRAGAAPGRRARPAGAAARRHRAGPDAGAERTPATARRAGPRPVAGGDRSRPRRGAHRRRRARPVLAARAVGQAPMNSGHHAAHLVHMAVMGLLTSVVAPALVAGTRRAVPWHRVPAPPGLTLPLFVLLHGTVTVLGAHTNREVRRPSPLPAAGRTSPAPFSPCWPARGVRGTPSGSATDHFPWSARSHAR